MDNPFISNELSYSAVYNEHVEIYRKQASKNLRLLRETIGVNQDTFAKVMGISRAALSYYENGSRTPDIDFINTVSLKTGCGISFLLGQSNSMRDDCLQISEFLDMSDKEIAELISLSRRKGFSAFFRSKELRKMLFLIETGTHDVINGIDNLELKRWQCLKIMDGLINEMLNSAMDAWLSDPYLKEAYEKKLEKEREESEAMNQEYAAWVAECKRESEKSKAEQLELDKENPFAQFRNKMQSNPWDNYQDYLREED